MYEFEFRGNLPSFAMDQEIIIELVDMNRRSLTLDGDMHWPEGVSMEGPMVRSAKSLGGVEGAVFFVLTIAVTAGAKKFSEVTAEKLADCLFEYFGKRKPKRIYIEEEEAVFEKGDLVRVISKKMKIDK